MAAGKIGYRLAVGLSYDAATQQVPGVNLKGDACLADRIVELARRFGVAVIENTELAKALNCVELDEEIPERLYRAVAVIINQLEESQKNRSRHGALG